jgi:hypothetical protein
MPPDLLAAIKVFFLNFKQEHTYGKKLFNFFRKKATVVELVLKVKLVPTFLI